jgi:hypothetical protein
VGTLGTCLFYIIQYIRIYIYIKGLRIIQLVPKNVPKSILNWEHGNKSFSGNKKVPAKTAGAEKQTRKQTGKQTRKQGSEDRQENAPRCQLDDSRGTAKIQKNGSC